jgi:GntR family transcriptional repressor for pyruvate dehydrogenase complex
MSENIHVQAGGTNITAGARPRVSQDVGVRIAEMILSGKFETGKKLPPERALAEQFSITRTSLREALRRLEHLGLLLVRPGDGIYVRDYREHATMEFLCFVAAAGLGLSPELARMMDDARRFVAVGIVEQAVRGADVAALSALRAVAEAWPINPTPELLSGDLDMLFYTEPARAAKNSAFILLLNSMRELFLQTRWVYAQPDGRAAAAAAVLNRRIVDAIADGKRKKAVALIEKRLKLDSLTDLDDDE